MRAFEVAEYDYGGRGVGGAYGRVPFWVELCEIFSEGVGGEVKHFAAEEGFAVFTDEDCAFVGLAVYGYFDGDGVEIRGGRGGERTGLDFEVGAPGEEFAHEGFSIFQNVGFFGGRDIN